MAIKVPSITDQLFDPRALAEGRAAASSLKTEHLIKLVQAQKKEAYDNERELRSAWREWWGLWLNQVDFSDKEEWQTKLWVPKPFTAVEQATALIQRSLLDSADAFSVDGVDERDKLIAARVWRPLTRFMLDKAEFATQFSDASKMGFITGLAGYLKFRWVANAVPKLAGIKVNPQTGTVEPQFTKSVRNALVIDNIPPWRIFRDPDSKPRKNFSGTYIIHSEWKDRPILRAMQAAGWNAEAIETLLQTPGGKGASGLIDHETEEFEEFRRQWTRHEFRKSYLIDEAWGDILDENGEPVFPNALLIVSDNQVLYGPVDSPLWATDMNTGRRKTPFLASTPLIHPTRFIGRGIVEQDAPLSHLFSNVFMLWADGLNWRVNPPTEIFQDALVDWEDTDHFPGKLWVKHTDKPALLPAQIGQMNTNEIMAALEYIDRNRQNSNFVTDFVAGLPGTRSDITKGEVQIKTGQSLAIFEAMSRNLEQLGRDSVELAYNFAVQYMIDFSNPDIKRILGEETAFLIGNLSIAERIDQLQGSYDFTFTGVSQALQKAEQLQKVMQFATLLSSPIFAQALQTPSDVVRVIADLLNVTERIRFNEAPTMLPGQVTPPGQVPAQPPESGTGPTVPGASAAPGTTPQIPTAAGILAQVQAAGQPGTPAAVGAQGPEGF